MIEFLKFANFALLAGLVSGAPYLGGPVYHQSLVDPYVYLPPNPTLYYQNPYLYSLPHHQQLVSSPGLSSPLYQVPQVGQSVEDYPEINQFHTEDAQGRVLYGFHGHNQARMEARDSEGRVRGSYSYIDPNGQLVRMDYWDDGNGFQARGQNVPKALYDVPGFTPEVQAARDQHFKLYQQILLSNVQAQQSHLQIQQPQDIQIQQPQHVEQPQHSQVQQPQYNPVQRPQVQPPHVQPPNQLPVDDYPYVERPDGASATPTGYDDEDDTVEVGVYPYPNQPNEPSFDRPTNVPSYPSIPNDLYPSRPSDPSLYPSRPSDQPSYPSRPSDAPSYPSDDQSYPGSMRQPGLFQQPNFPFQNQDDEDPESIALDNPEFQDLGRGAKSLEAKDNKQEGSNQKDEVQTKSKNEMKTQVKSDEKKMMEKQDGTENENTHNGFGYHIQYKVGTPAQIQATPNFKKVSGIASSEPIPTNQKAVHRVHPLPLHTMTNMMDRPSGFHDQQVRQGLQQPMIIKTAQPSAAVHDMQVMRRSKNLKDGESQN